MRTFCNRNTFYNRYRHKKVRIFGKFAFMLKCERSHFTISFKLYITVISCKARNIRISEITDK